MLPNLYISIKNSPTFIFLIDQSGSMGERLPDGRIKAEVISDSVNRAINSLIKISYNTFNYIIPIQIGILGYGGRGVINLLSYLGEGFLHSLVYMANAPLRMEKRRKKEKNPAGEIFEAEINFPIWIEPAWFGGTPMCAAFFKLVKNMRDLKKNVPALNVPVIFNICDGKSTDGDIEDLGKMLLNFTFSANEVLLYNMHLSSGYATGGEWIFPCDDFDLPDEFSKKLLRISCRLPLHALPQSGKSFPLGREPRGLMYNVKNYEKIVDFFNILNKCPLK